MCLSCMNALTTIAYVDWIPPSVSRFREPFESDTFVDSMEDWQELLPVRPPAASVLAPNFHQKHISSAEWKSRRTRGCVVPAPQRIPTRSAALHSSS